MDNRLYKQQMDRIRPHPEADSFSWAEAKLTLMAISLPIMLLIIVAGIIAAILQLIRLFS
jgi:hypothetical protein